MSFHLCDEELLDKTMEENSDEPQDNLLGEILLKMRRLEQRMEARLWKMEEDVQKRQEEALEKASKRARKRKSYTFKKRGHQRRASSATASQTASIKYQRRLCVGWWMNLPW